MAEWPTGVRRSVTGKPFQAVGPALWAAVFFPRTISYSYTRWRECVRGRCRLMRMDFRSAHLWLLFTPASDSLHSVLHHTRNSNDDGNRVVQCVLTIFNVTAFLCFDQLYHHICNCAVSILSKTVGYSVYILFFIAEFPFEMIALSATICGQTAVDIWFVYGSCCVHTSLGIVN